MLLLSLISEDVEIAGTTQCNMGVSLTPNDTDQYQETNITTSHIYFKPPIVTFEPFERLLPISEQANLSIRLGFTPGTIKVRKEQRTLDG